MQVQREQVHRRTGAGAGASVNMQTEGASMKPYAEFRFLWFFQHAQGKPLKWEPDC